MSIQDLLSKYPIQNSEWCHRGLSQGDPTLAEFIRLKGVDDVSQYQKFRGIGEFMYRRSDVSNSSTKMPQNIDPWNRKFPEHPNRWIPPKPNAVYHWSAIRSDVFKGTIVGYVYVTTVEQNKIYCFDEVFSL